MALNKEMGMNCRKMNIHRMQRGLCCCCFTVVAMVVLRSYFFLTFPYAHLRRGLQVCIQPHLDVNNSLMSSFFQRMLPLECDSERDWVCVDRGYVKICDDFLVEHPETRCNYSFYGRVDDHRNEIVAHFENVAGSVQLLSDFFGVQCEDRGVAANGSKARTWRNVVAAVRRDPAVVNRSAGDLPQSSPRLNVLVFGYDSLSRLTFMRKLPETYRYLQELGTVVLKGYNIVGDGTPQALIPILTGRTEVELPETRKRMGDDAQFVNVYPFVWDEFRRSGYVTAYAEDCPGIGTFTYRLKGFDRQPTDHYMRPFYVEVDKIMSEHKKLCLGSKPRHKVMMDYLEDLFDAYDDRPKFAFAFHGELSHDDLNLVEVADNDTVNMLRHLKEKGHLQKTMLIVMSDHGHRFAKIRETQQGKQEERMPFFSITMPPWFRTKHPKAWKNLVTNSERLTTPFDIHPTLKSVLNFSQIGLGSVKQRGISLFAEVPLTRSCVDADIEAHWCVCLNWEPESTSSPLAQQGAKTLVEHLNRLTAPHTNICHVLKLDSIERAEKYVPRSDLLRFKKNADVDGFVGDFSDNTAVSEVIYQVKIVTAPGDGHFEASLSYDVASKRFRVRPDAISRVNAYGKAALCIADTEHDLRKYCYCKDQG